VWPLFRKGG